MVPLKLILLQQAASLPAPQLEAAVASTIILVFTNCPINTVIKLMDPPFCPEFAFFSETVFTAIRWNRSNGGSAAVLASATPLPPWPPEVGPTLKRENKLIYLAHP